MPGIRRSSSTSGRSFPWRTAKAACWPISARARKGFQKNFLTDVGALREGLLNEEYSVGDFEFARHGVGPAFESFMVVGKGIYLICNNTVQSMDAHHARTRSGWGRKCRLWS